MKTLAPLALAALGLTAIASSASAQTRYGWDDTAEPIAVISPNTTVNGMLDPRDESDGSRYLDRLTLSVRRGQTVTVDLRSRDFDAVVRVEQGGWLLAENDDRRSGDRDSFVSIVAPQDGALDVIVTSWASWSTGAYAATVSVEDMWAPPPPVISYGGGTILGELDLRDERDWSGTFRDRHFVDVRAGEQVRIDLSSRDFDTVLEVTHDGRSIAHNDDLAAGIRDSSVWFEAPYSGVYEVIASSYRSGDTGRYEIRIDVDSRPQPIHVVAPAPVLLPPPPVFVTPRPVHDHRPPPPVVDHRPPPPRGGYLPDRPRPPHRR